MNCIRELFPFSNIESASDFYAAVIGNSDDCLIDLQLLNEVKLELKCDFMTSVEFYLYPTVGTVLIHSVKPELTE